MLCFSWFKNHQEFKSNWDLPDKALIMFDGLKVLSLYWMLSINMLLLFLGINLKNLSIAYWIVNLYIYATIWTAFYALDAYMFFMCVTNFMAVRKYYLNHKGINIIDYGYLIFRRLVKVVPTFYIIFFSFWAFTPFLSESPMWFITNTNF